MSSIAKILKFSFDTVLMFKSNQLFSALTWMQLTFVQVHCHLHLQHIQRNNRVRHHPQYAHAQVNQIRYFKALEFFDIFFISTVTYPPPGHPIPSINFFSDVFFYLLQQSYYSQARQESGESLQLGCWRRLHAHNKGFLALPPSPPIFKIFEP